MRGMWGSGGGCVCIGGWIFSFRFSIAVVWKEELDIAAAVALVWVI